MPERPPLSIVLPIRHATPEARAAVASVLPQARATGSEVIVVGLTDIPLPEWVRVVPTTETDLFRMRQAGLECARGEIVAIAEDHAVPRPDWCASVIRAHRDQPDVAAIAGCLVNATAATRSGRANFLTFAAQSIDPTRARPAGPPPLSALTFKRRVLGDAPIRLGELETEVVPRLFTDGEMVGDASVVVDHYQDHGPAWSLANAFHAARAGYGYAQRGRSWSERARQAIWGIVHVPRRAWAERARFAPETRFEPLVLALVCANATALGLGAAVGSLFGPGSSGSRVA
ncbi:MAG: glycosyltransferase family A protein [Acidimicrobiia bacterium]